MLSKPDELSCKEVVMQVTDYLEYKLLPEMREYFEVHLACCPGCATYIEQIRQTISILHTITEDQFSPEIKQACLQTFRNWQQEEELIQPFSV